MTVDLRAFPELLVCHVFQNITLPCHLQVDNPPRSRGVWSCSRTSLGALGTV
jgi:hypothetical protein